MSEKEDEQEESARPAFHPELKPAADEELKETGRHENEGEREEGPRDSTRDVGAAQANLEGSKGSEEGGAEIEDENLETEAEDAPVQRPRQTEARPEYMMTLPMAELLDQPKESADEQQSLALE